jgi:hypothetical protein
MEATISKPRPRTVAQKHQSEDHNYNNILCARSIALLENHALAAGLMPCRPATDIRGYDVIMERGGKFYRAQVRACGNKRGKQSQQAKSLTFSILRAKQKKSKNAHDTARRHFLESEIDVFIFVHVDAEMLFVVPVVYVDLNRTKFTVQTDGVWRNAWHLLQ